MSFSQTPLGQGRRLNHFNFHNKPPIVNRVPSPPRLLPPVNHTDDDGNNNDDDDPESALVRFARLKQQQAAQQIRLNPESWAVKDTTVNIAAAFTLAADTDMPSSNTATYTRQPSVPRSTSVEYEREAQASIAKRLAAPPSRRSVAPRKPISQTTSLRHVPDSEPENEPELVENTRGRSPFHEVVSSAKRALGTTSFYLQQKMKDVTESSTETLAPQNDANDPNYDYAQEEETYNMNKESTTKNNHAAPRRGRISQDNQAYKPPQSDPESSDDDNDLKDRSKKRKKFKRDGIIGGPLTTLPVMKGEKKRPKRSKNGTGAPGDTEGGDFNGAEDQNVDRTPSVLRDSIPPSIRHSSLPPQRQPSVPRSLSLPPDPHGHSFIPEDDAEQGLTSIPEVDEEDFNARDEAYHFSPPPSRIGGPLGHVVNLAARTVKALIVFAVHILTALLYFFGKIIGTIYDVLLRQPMAWVSGASPPHQALAKILVISLVLSMAWMYRGALTGYLPSARESVGNTQPIFKAPNVPAADMMELSARLQRIESVLSSMSVDAERGRQKVDSGAREQLELVEKLSALEGRLVAEQRRYAEVDVREREREREIVKAVQKEVGLLREKLVKEIERQKEKQHGNDGSVGADEEVRNRVKALEERVGSVESGVKAALDSDKKMEMKEGVTWSPETGTKPVLTIKSTDGSDVTAIISQLVDSAVSIASKDTLAKPDYALYSGGARVIPTLTSPTFEMRPATWAGQMLGLLTGNGYGIGLPPIMALHHETVNGRCWSFPGNEGQLGVVLAAPVYVEEVSLDHVAQEVAYDMRSAPRECELWGMVEGADNVEKVERWLEGKKRTQAVDGEDVTTPDYQHPPTLPKSPRYVRLANFTYDIHAPRSVQTFPVDPEIRALGVDFGIVVLLVKSNWGREEYTCLYRLRVHGQRLSEKMPLPLLNPTSPPQEDV